MFFMQFAVWGAWMPVLAARLLGPLKMTGKQTGWIYATFPLASMISPLFFGQLADKWVDAAWIMAGCHLVGAVLMFFAARMEKFGPLFVVMLLYSMAYAATLPLANALVLRHAANAPNVFIWAPVAWALVGYFLTGLRQAKGAGDGSDCLYLAAILSVVTAAVCLFQPASPPQGSQGQPMLDAISMLKDPNYLLFMVVSTFVAGTMQFYFLGTAPFMQEMGISSKNVPGAMAMAQAVQAVATLVALGTVYQSIGPKWTLALGAASWFMLYVVYMIGRPAALIVVSQGFHGLAYVLFIMGGWTYVAQVAPTAIGGSAQALISLVTMGIGLFFGTQAAGFFMERAKVNDKFQWGRVWSVPLIVTLVGTLALAGVFHAPPVKKADEKPAEKAAAVAVEQGPQT
jgi:MFS family permease